MWVALAFAIGLNGSPAFAYLDHPVSPGENYAAFKTEAGCKHALPEFLKTADTAQVRAVAGYVNAICVRVDKAMFETRQGYRLRDWDDRGGV